MYLKFVNNKKYKNNVKYQKNSEKPCLMGLMGSGKTSIGRNLSKLLNLNFIDTDHEIEKSRTKYK